MSSSEYTREQERKNPYCNRLRLTRFPPYTPLIPRLCSLAHSPSLFTPLVDTLDAFTLPNHTVTLVVIELRSDEATLAFLETWLGSDQRWRIWAVPAEQMSCGLDRGYAAWVAWKEQ